MKRGRKSAAELSIVTPDEPETVRDWTPPEPPVHLSASASAWWREVTAEYVLEPHHLRLLQSACECWDRAQEARSALAAHGALTYTDERGKISAHPCVQIERDNRTLFARLLRELYLDAAGPNQAVRLPALNSNRG